MLKSDLINLDMPIYLEFHKISQKNYWTYTSLKKENSWAIYYSFVSVFKGSINVSERVPEKFYAGGKFNLCLMVTDNNGFSN